MNLLSSGVLRFRQLLQPRIDALTTPTFALKPPSSQDEVEAEESRFELADWLGSKLDVASASEIVDKIGEQPLIIVINRSIFTLDSDGNELIVKSAPGGAASALFAALRSQGGGVVIATATTDLERRVARSGLLVSPGDNIWVHYLYVPEETFDLFYNEFANPALWLIQHGMGDSILPRPQTRDWLLHPSDWIAYHLPWIRTTAIQRIIFTRALAHAYAEGYQRVNHQYAETIVKYYGGLTKPRIFIQDYHFYLLPLHLRELGCKAFLDHFIHIPWMPLQYNQRVLPPSLFRDLLSSLLQNDVLGFQVRRYCQDFLTAARALLGAEVDFETGMVLYKGHATLVQHYPISVDVGRLRRIARVEPEGSATLNFVQGLRRKMGQKLLIVRADRVDLSKGIQEGFEALGLVMAREPGLREQVHLLALMQPSRLDVPEYRNLLGKTKALVRAFNARWSPSVAWDGIVEDQAGREAYLRDLADATIREWPVVVADFTEKPFIEVVGAQIAADVGLVNPIADGMNLVAKEFAVNNKPSFIRDFNQRLRRSGFQAVGVVPAVIVGSNLMGAYYELRNGLLAIDPRSPSETATVLQRALGMQRQARGLAGRRSRLDHLPARLRQLFQEQPVPELLADVAAEQVSRHTIEDWMDAILLDMELVRDPDWQQAVHERGLAQSRGAVERGMELRDALGLPRSPQV